MNAEPLVEPLEHFGETVRDMHMALMHRLNSANPLDDEEKRALESLLVELCQFFGPKL